MYKLIAQMIGRNEEHRFIRDVLQHLIPQVDMIVYTDDASQDNTPEVFREAGAHVYCNKDPLFNIHEGQLRQCAWHNLSKHADVGDWILAIDCDEKLYSTDPSQSIPVLLERTRFHAIAVMFYHMWNPDQYRADKGWAPAPQARIFRFVDGCPFSDNALGCGSGPAYVRYCELTEKMQQNTGLVMQHFGYIHEQDRRAKYDRYMELDQGRYHELSHIKSILDPDPELFDWKTVCQPPVNMS